MMKCYRSPPMTISAKFDDEMTESGYLNTEDALLISYIMQDDSNGEQDSSRASNSTHHNIVKSSFNCADWTYDSDNRVRWVGPPPELLVTVEDFADHDTYYLVVNSLERIQERSHHADASP